MWRKLLAAAVLLTVLLAGCNVQDMQDVYEDDTKIAGTYNSFTRINYRQMIQDDSCTGTVGKFNGMDTLWSATAAEGEEMELTYRLDVTAGRAKLVLILPDGTVQVVAEDSGEQETPDSGIATLTLGQGENRLKLVAVEAAFAWSFSTDTGRWSMDD